MRRIGFIIVSICITTHCIYGQNSIGVDNLGAVINLAKQGTNFQQLIGNQIILNQVNSEGDILASTSFDFTKISDITVDEKSNSIYIHVLDISHSERNGNYNKNIYLTANDSMVRIFVRNNHDFRKFMSNIEYVIDDNTQTASKESYIPQYPPIIEIVDIKFNEENNDNIINAGERNEISFKLLNKGKGDSKNIEIIVHERNSIKHLSYSKLIRIGDINANEQKEISIPLKSNLELISDTALFLIKVIESNGFNPAPITLEILTQGYTPPKVRIVDYKFSSERGGTIQKGYPINVKLAIQNLGHGTAENVVLNFNLEENVFSAGPTKYDIGILTPGMHEEVEYEFFTNKIYSKDEINLVASVTEKNLKFGEVKSLNVSLSDNLDEISKVVISANPQEKSSITINEVSYSSSVDKNVPINPPKLNRIALIIGNEDYTSYQPSISHESNVIYAINDAKVFREYAIKTLGVEERNCFFLTNATAGIMTQYIELITKMGANMSHSEIIFYYAGHGYPDESTKIPYLIPVDINYSNLNSAVKLSELYKKLASSEADRITVFLDACFSGGGRESGLLSARGITVKPKEEILNGKVVVFTAASNDQSALPFKKEYHGMFTFFLLKKLQESKGNLSYEELGDFIIENVSLESLRVNHKEQIPNIMIGNDIMDDWKLWTFQ
jgi:hypothetical protein